MSRDLIDENYYMTSGGKIPVKWTAPEVAVDQISCLYVILLLTAGSTLQKILSKE